MFSVIVMPRYLTELFLRFAESVCSHEEYVCVNNAESHRMTFGKIKLHLPISLTEDLPAKYFIG